MRINTTNTTSLQLTKNIDNVKIETILTVEKILLGGFQ